MYTYSTSPSLFTVQLMAHLFAVGFLVLLLGMSHSEPSIRQFRKSMYSDKNRL